jgi:hypothetical protein
MRLKLATFSRYRPRFLTLIILSGTMATLVLANLSYDVRAVQGANPPNFLTQISIGWPFRWHRYIFNNYWYVGTVAWQFSAGRLAGNAALWFVMLAAPAVGCEWLLRRYRPGLRWSLRTMLATVGLIVACCAWFVAARDRARLQDPVIAASATSDALVAVRRFGPKWLDLIGADRYRRQIIGVKLDSDRGDLPDEEVEAHLKLLALLPEVTYLSFEVNHLTPGMIDSLREMGQLRMLGVYMRQPYTDAPRDDKQTSHECLAAIGKMARLEHLRLREMVISGESLACLEGLKRLESLGLTKCINGDAADDDPYPIELGIDDPPLLRRLPELPRLVALDLDNSHVGDRDLCYLAVLPRLKSLNLAQTFVSGGGLAELACLESLEELAIFNVTDDGVASATGLEALLAVKRLKTLHIDRFKVSANRFALDNGGEISVPAVEAESFRRALKRLRQSRSGIVIDRYDDFEGMPTRPMEPTLPWKNGAPDEFYWNLPQVPTAERAKWSADELNRLKW